MGVMKRVVTRGCDAPSSPRCAERLPSERTLGPPAVLVDVKEERVRKLQERAQEEPEIAGPQRYDARDRHRHERGAPVGRQLVAVELRLVLRAVVAPMMTPVRDAETSSIVMDE